MARGPKEFRADLKRFGKKLEAALTDVPKEVTKETRTRVAFRTPILTGRASGSWNASVNQPDHSIKPEGYLNPAGAPMDGNVNVDGGKLGDKYYVANAIPYLPALNAGSSRKAPAGFIEMTAAELPLILPQIVRRIRAKHKL